jgi:hypothetical protein
MTTQELHIAIDVYFQKVNSHYNQNILTSEKDLFLNREQLRYVNKLINPLNSLKGQAAFDVVKKTVELAPLLNTYDAPILVDDNKKEAKLLLPFDCLYPVALRLNACPTCVSRNLVTHNIYELELDIIRDRNDLPLSIIQGDNIITIQPSDIPDAYLIQPNNPFFSNQFLIDNAIITLLKSYDSNIEFEYNKRKKKIIARSNGFFSIDSKGAKIVNYKKYEPFESDLFADVIIEDEEYLFRANNSSLSASKDKSVLSYIRDKEIKFYLPKGVIYGTCRMVYIRKPTKIDLLLNSNSNLTDESLSEVIGNLVQSLHGIIGTDNYEKFVRENTLIE